MQARGKMLFAKYYNITQRSNDTAFWNHPSVLWWRGDRLSPRN